MIAKLKGERRKMKEKMVLMSLVLIVSMLAMVAMPARAWEYFDTTVADPQTDNLVDYSGPHADRIQIRLYNNELTEFQALEAGQIDMTDWPIDTAHYDAWTQDPLQQKIGVSSKGAGCDMFILDMQMNPNPTLYPGGPPNPAYTAPFGNPMADVWLRRAIACVVDRRNPPLPYTGPLYTPLSSAYGLWQYTSIDPLGVLWQYTYVKQNSGDPDIDQGNLFLDLNGYLPIVGGKRTKGGVPFQIQFYYRADDAAMSTFATTVMMPLLTGDPMAVPKLGLGLDVVMIGVTSSGGRSQVECAKKGHLYTAFRELTNPTPTNPTPTDLYYLFHIDNYWHPGCPPNYMYYPGDDNVYTDPNNWFSYDGRGYGKDLVPYGFPSLNFAHIKMFPAGTWIWENPQNYWSQEIVTSGTMASAWKSQLMIAYWVCGVPVWHASHTAFHRTYTGGNDGVPVSPDDGENQYRGQPWKGVVNQKGYGVWSTFSFYDMHPANALFGDGENMTIRWGFRQPPMSLNPIYANLVWDWYVLNQAYDSAITSDPYTLEDAAWLATSWEVGTWDSPDYGTCTKVIFSLRHDVLWSDGMPMTSSDVKFTWGGPLMTGSLSNLLQKKGYPPAYWSGQVADILSIATPDPWTVIVYLDVYSSFGLYSMSGWNIILPEHIWKPIILTGDPTQPWNQPCVCTGGYYLPSTADPFAGVIILKKNPLHFLRNDPIKDKPINIYTEQVSNATARLGNTHWIYPRLGQAGVDANVTVWMHSTYVHETGPHIEDVYNRTWLDGTKNVTLWIWNGTGCPNQEENYKLYRTLTLNESWWLEWCIWEKEVFEIKNISAWWFKIKIEIHVDSLKYCLNYTETPWHNMTNFNQTDPFGSQWDGRAITSWIDHNENGILDLGDQIDTWNGTHTEWWCVESLIEGPPSVWTMIVRQCIIVPPQDNPYYCETIKYEEHMDITSRYDIGGLYWKPCPPATPMYQPIADLKTNVKDTYACGQAFGSRPGYPNWNTAADINNDFKVDVKDYYAICQNFGWTATYPGP
jgi:ABC-type transport system substrate-binding protein